MSTESSSFNSSIIRLLESAGNIPCTLMLPMASEGDCLPGMVFNIMGEMRTNPFADITEGFLEDDLLRIDSLKNDVRACLKQLMVWEKRYTDEMDATLKAKVDKEITKMEADFKAYKLSMAAEWSSTSSCS